MSGELRSVSFRTAHRRYNFAAAMVAGGAIAFLYFDLNFHAATAEEGKNNPAPQMSSLTSSILAPSKLARVKQTASLEQMVPNPLEPQINGDAELAQSTADRYAVLFVISQLQRGIEKLERCNSYSAIFERQERIAGELKDQQQIEIKLRHAPFSVYMKWLNGDRGRQLLYTHNQNEGKMLVQMGGIKGALVGALKLDPAGDLAMKETRHPVTQAGLIPLAKEIIHHRQHDLESGNLPRCYIEEGHEFDGRPCYKMVIEYRKKEPTSIYRKAITLIDSELSLPVYVRNYTWPNENTVNVEEETLVECYCYSKIKFDDQLADAVWQHDNPDYRLRVR